MEINETMKYLMEKSTCIGRYSDKLRESVKAIDSALEDAFKTAGISYTDPEPICQLTTPYGTTNYKLCITKAEITKGQNNVAWGIFIVDGDDEYSVSPTWIGHAQRDIIKAAVPRLSTFITQYTERVEFEMKGYESVSKLAESIKNKLNR